MKIETELLAIQRERLSIEVLKMNQKHDYEIYKLNEENRLRQAQLELEYKYRMSMPALRFGPQTGFPSPQMGFGAQAPFPGPQMGFEPQAPFPDPGEVSFEPQAHFSGEPETGRTFGESGVDA